ncbi:MAG: TerC family protein [Actinomycetota bacterium]|nr:MAG: TerC family protein [Actinomycetota bacterium]
MNVPVWLWVATLVGLVAIIAIDLILVDSHPHSFGVKEATRWVLVYVALAVAFGIGIWIWAGSQYAGEFFAGYITEYSLSVDNLFVFIVIMATFAVPLEQQHRVLLFGVVIALVLRAVLIVVGAAAIERFAVTFYLFGALLLFTAVQLLRSRNETPEPGNNPLLRLAERVIPTTRTYDGSRLFTRIDGRRLATPMLLVMIAIGTTDVLFALDSIPAIFGLTHEPFLVFTANAFALMGLRQLFFLVRGLLDRLVYLSIGLAVILAFIGVKLVLHAIHETTSLDVPEVSIGVSLAVIIGVLIITTVASLIKVSRDPSAVSHVGMAADAAREAAAHDGEELQRLRGYDATHRADRPEE